jgi:hypothetical protein
LLEEADIMLELGILREELTQMDLLLILFKFNKLSSIILLLKIRGLFAHLSYKSEGLFLLIGCKDRAFTSPSLQSNVFLILFSKNRWLYVFGNKKTFLRHCYPIWKFDIRYKFNENKIEKSKRMFAFKRVSKCCQFYQSRRLRWIKQFALCLDWYEASPSFGQKNVRK